MGSNDNKNAAVSPQQEAFIDRLLEGMSVPEAAATLRTHRSTCWRWLQVAEVQNELTRRREERRTAVAEELGGAALEAVRLLRSMLSDTALTPQGRLRTACAPARRKR